MSNGTLLTADDVAARLAISTRSAYDLMAPGGALHPFAVRISRKVVRIAEQDLDAYIENNKGQPQCNCTNS